MIEEGNAQLERDGHTHLIGIAQEHASHVTAKLCPADPGKVVRELDRTFERRCFAGQAGRLQHRIGEEPAAPLCQCANPSIVRQVGQAISQSFPQSTRQHDRAA
mgnify:CR=1 FL=1